MTVLNAENAILAALKFLPAGSQLTVFTKNAGTSRTNVVAELRKGPGRAWADWEILRRPVTANHTLLPATWPHEVPEVISPSDLAHALNADSDLWAEVED